MSIHVASTYGIPRELMEFVENGFLKLLSEDEAKRTIEFHIPSRRSADAEGRITAYAVTWIHPDHNVEFCHYYANEPGDLPNFYVERQNSEAASESIDDLEDVDDFVAWLGDLQAAGAI